MSEQHDPETGEILPPVVVEASPRNLPREIAGAIIQVMRGVKQLGYDENNPHARYDYASIDKFLSHFGPACAAAGIAFMLDEVSVEVRPGGKEGSSYLFIEYEVWIMHELGAMAGPWKRRCYLPATGPQAFGSAESYVLKRFMRNLFQVPTGEKDADDTSPGNLPNRAARPATASRATPAKQAPQQAAGTDRAREAWRYVTETIASCASASDVRSVYDPVLDEWGEAVASHVALIAAVPGSGPQNVEALKDRAKAKMNQFIGNMEHEYA